MLFIVLRVSLYFYVTTDYLHVTVETATGTLSIAVLNTHFTMLLWPAKLSMPLYATQCMNSTFCAALNAVYRSILVSELKTTHKHIRVYI